MRRMHVHRLGRVEYEDGLKLQALFGLARAADAIPDTLLLLEHPPVLTLGRAAKRENVLATEAELGTHDVQLFETNRGGDVTYHGPGQIVGYPLFKLEGARRDVRAYVRSLEEALIRTAADFGIVADRIPEWTGVWVGAKGAPGTAKIAAIGVHISRWQTSHGFALNVNTQLGHFGWIVPCGIREAGVTSMQERLGREVPLTHVEDALVRHFAQLFDAEPVEQEAATRTVSVVVAREGQSGPEILCLRRTPPKGGFWQIVTGRIEPGEAPLKAAARELFEETGARCDVQPLEYEHAFAFGDESPPRVYRETAFVARWPAGRSVQLSPEEHDASEWLPAAIAIERLPFAGLQRAVRLAVQGR